MRHRAARRKGRPVAGLVLSTTALAAALLVPAAPAQALRQSTQPATTAPAYVRPWAATWSWTLYPGSSGAAVKAAQLRLSALGYWNGTADGRYGPLTTQAVLAVQKTVGLRRTGVLDAATRRILVEGVRPQARSTVGTTFEVDLRRQLLFVVVNGRTRWAFNTSTGNGQVYYLYGRRYVAATPRGRFQFVRQVNGADNGPLGGLWRPKYFYQGYAVHGAVSVPAYPASHGCVRLSDGAINYLWAAGLAPLGHPIWVY